MVDEHRAHVGFNVDAGFLICECHDAGRRRRPDTGQSQQFLVGIRHATAMLGRAFIGSALQSQGPAVVSQALPFFQHIGNRRAGQSIHRGECRKEARPMLQHARHLGLLQHGFGNIDLIGVVDKTPGQTVTAVLFAHFPNQLPEAAHMLECDRMLSRTAEHVLAFGLSLQSPSPRRFRWQ